MEGPGRQKADSEKPDTQKFWRQQVHLDGKRVLGARKFSREEPEARLPQAQATCGNDEKL